MLCFVLCRFSHMLLLLLLLIYFGIFQKRSSRFLEVSGTRLKTGKTHWNSLAFEFSLVVASTAENISHLCDLPKKDLVDSWKSSRQVSYFKKKSQNSIEDIQYKEFFFFEIILNHILLLYIDSISLRENGSENKIFMLYLGLPYSQFSQISNGMPTRKRSSKIQIWDF